MNNFFTDEDLLKALSRMAFNGIDDADIYLQNSFSEAFMLSEHQVKSANYYANSGFGVRAVVADQCGFAHSSKFSLVELAKSCSFAKKIKDSSKALIKEEISPKKLDFPKLYQEKNPLEDENFIRDKKIELLHFADNLAYKLDPRVIDVSCSLMAEFEEIKLARLDGLIAQDIRPLIRFNVSVVVEQNGRREQGYCGAGARLSYSDYFADFAKVEALVKEAVEKAIINLDSRPAPAGKMPVVLGNGWTGILLHEAVGHGLEGDFNRKKTSIFSDKMGQQVCSPLCTVIDEGNIKDRRGSLNFDDEGTLTQKNVLIENGVLVGYMQDRQNARLMGVNSTGNGRRESFAHLPMPRMTNTYLAAGNHSQEEMIKSVKKGIFAQDFGGGQVDITTGQFSFSATTCYLIEDGKITAPLKGATLIGNGLEVMQKISMVGADLALDAGVGSCGKNGQSVPVGVGMPSVKVESLTVGGTA